MATTSLETRAEQQVASPPAAPQSLVDTVLTPSAEQVAPPTQIDHRAQFEFLAQQDEDEGMSDTSPSRRWAILSIVAGGVVLLILGFAVAASTGLLPGWGVDDFANLLTKEIDRGDVVVTVTAKGTLESANNRNFKCQVESASGSKIKWILENGEKVKKGDKLLEFDPSALDESIKQQEINLKTQKAVMDQAKNDHATAQEAVKEYEEGVFQETLQTFESQVVIAKENLSSAENALQHAERMFQKGYISDLQLESQRFGVTNAKLELKKAETAVKTLTNYTKKKMLIDLKGKEATAKTKMESEEDKYKLEIAKLDRLKDQLNKCIIIAPQDGMVEYAVDRSSRWGGGDRTTIEVGSVISLGRDVLRMPDLSQMQAKVMVNETKVDRVKPGNAALIKTAQGVEYDGEVEYIANQSDQRSFMQASVTEFPVMVKITEQMRGEQRPGMTVDVLITVDDRHKNVIRVPVTAVVHSGKDSVCWVKTKAGVEHRALKLRMNGDKFNPSLVTDDAFFVVDDGLKEGDEVVINPRSVIPEAKELEQVAKQEREKVAKEKQEAKEKKPATPGDEKGKDGPRKGGAGGGGAGGGRADWWKKLDQNADGKLARDEAGPMAARFDDTDANKDGFLDETEITKAMESFRKKAPGGGSPGAGTGGAP
jgi:multidrug efflux pump subunit AcrA (membrane-fusion protein)